MYYTITVSVDDEDFVFFISRNVNLRNQVYDFLKTMGPNSNILDRIGTVSTFKKGTTNNPIKLWLDYLDFITVEDEMLVGHKTKSQLIDDHNQYLNSTELRLLRQTFGPEII